MAQTYTVSALGIAFALNKSMIAIFNGSGSGRIVRVYRIWMLNSATTAVTGGLNSMELRRITTGSGGTALSPNSHDSNNENFPAQVVAATNASVTTDALLRRWLWSTDEPVAATALTIDELETIPSLNCVWDVGYGETDVEPLTLREGYGVSVQCTGSTATGVVDLFIECTLASS